MAFDYCRTAPYLALCWIVGYRKRDGPLAAKGRVMDRKTPSKAEVLRDLETMLRDVLTATEAGRSYARMARAHGYVDGFMRGLLDTGFVAKSELLEIVARERMRVSGPATAESRDDLDATTERIVAA
jgi:hypothetical protein